MSTLDAFEALLSLPVDDHYERHHHLVQEGDPRRMDTVWPRFAHAYTAHRMADKDAQQGEATT